MRKILFSAVLVSILVACDKKAEKVDSTTTENTTEETSSTSSAKSSDVKFSNTEVQKIADEYATFVKEYVEAYKSGDATKIQDLVKKQQEWATKLSSVATTMTPEDTKAWVDYMQKLSDEMTAAAMPAK